MLLKIKFEFLDSLKNEEIILEAESFEEDGIQYVKRLINLTTNKEEKINPYCPLKSLRGVLQLALPLARIKEINSLS